jgi:hypothetical protein
MKTSNQKRFVAQLPAILIVAIVAGASFTTVALGASWNRIEPLKSRRTDVLQALGPPVSESSEGVLRYNVNGGSVQISFVDDKFVAAKKLKPELAGTVLLIILQHEHSSDTPESMRLLKNRQFTRDEVQGVTVFRNVKDGIVYSFIDGALKTTRYTFADGQLFRARR